MHDVEQTMRRRIRELEAKKVPFIVYCHYRDGSCGMTAIELGKVVVKPKTDLKRWEGHKEDTLSAGFLRSLNKHLRDLQRGWPHSTVKIVANLDLLTPEDREKVNSHVPVLHDLIAAT